MLVDRLVIDTWRRKKPLALTLFRFPFLVVSKNTYAQFTVLGESSVSEYDEKFLKPQQTKITYIW